MHHQGLGTAQLRC